jgi:tetratricopeptide (TPR) repeat protein
MTKPQRGRVRKSNGSAQLGKLIPFKPLQRAAPPLDVAPGPLAGMSVPGPDDTRAQAAAEASYEQAHAAEEAGDIESAKAEYWRAIAADPSLSDAYINMGRLLHEGGRPDQAVALYSAAIALRADDLIAHFNLGVAFEDLGQLDEAIAAYERSIALKPDSVDAHYNVARLYQMLGRSEEASQHLVICRRLTRRRAR